MPKKKPFTTRKERKEKESKTIGSQQVEEEPNLKEGEENPDHKEYDFFLDYTKGQNQTTNSDNVEDQNSLVSVGGESSPGIFSWFFGK